VAPLNIPGVSLRADRLVPAAPLALQIELFIVRSQPLRVIVWLRYRTALAISPIPDGIAGTSPPSSPLSRFAAVLPRFVCQPPSCVFAESVCALIDDLRHPCLAINPEPSPPGALKARSIFIASHAVRVSCNLQVQPGAQSTMPDISPNLFPPSLPLQRILPVSEQHIGHVHNPPARRSRGCLQDASAIATVVGRDLRLFASACGRCTAAFFRRRLSAARCCENALPNSRAACSAAACALSSAACRCASLLRFLLCRTASCEPAPPLASCASASALAAFRRRALPDPLPAALDPVRGGRTQAYLPRGPARLSFFRNHRALRVFFRLFFKPPLRGASSVPSPPLRAPRAPLNFCPALSVHILRAMQLCCAAAHNRRRILGRQREYSRSSALRASKPTASCDDSKNRRSQSLGSTMNDFLAPKAHNAHRYFPPLQRVLRFTFSPAPPTFPRRCTAK